MRDFRDVALFNTSNDTLDELSKLTVITIKLDPEAGLTRKLLVKLFICMQ